MPPVSAETKLQELGLVLPVPPKPVASYVPYVVAGREVWIAGQVPTKDGKPVFTGKLGKEVTLEKGQEAARLCALNGLAQLKAAAGSLDKVKRVLKVQVFVAVAPGFTDIAKVANGASDLLGQVFGERGKHARTSVGVAELPLGVPVEVDFVAELE